MILRDINFGPVFDASGVRGFFGEGYWFHKYLKPFGLDFSGSTFVAKTTTLEPKKGNMPIYQDSFMPVDKMPKCIKVKFWKGATLNAIGLSGPGAQALFEAWEWQKRKRPFFLSFMSVAETRMERLEELLKFVNLFYDNYIKDFQAPIGLQINFSCPNVDVSFDDFVVPEIQDALNVASLLGIPLMPKFNILTPIGAVKNICEHAYCDAICVSNTIPWGALPKEIDWEALFGSRTWPLAEFGGGGLSGKPLLPLVADWVKQAREAGITKPINAGGGILCFNDVKTLFDAGADSIFLGSAAFLRPWRVRGIIHYAHTFSTQRR